jgi:hypothetical protein
MSDETKERLIQDIRRCRATFRAEAIYTEIERHVLASISWRPKSVSICVCQCRFCWDNDPNGIRPLYQCALDLHGADSVDELFEYCPLPIKPKEEEHDAK